VSHELLLPRLSDTMEEGSVLRWLKQPGERVTKGEPIVEVDTDKVTVVLDAPADGWLGEILVPAGGVAPIGATLVNIVADLAATATSAAAVPPAAHGTPTPPDTERDAPEAHPRARVRATPLARKLARGAGLDLTLLTGGGPEGRIMRSDVDAALSPVPSARVFADRGANRIEPTRLQTALARRMTESKQQIPHYYMTVDVDVTDALSLRHQAQQLQPPVKFSLTDLVVRSCGLTLVQHPEVNGAWIDGAIVQYEHANIGIAVALDDGGLIVPVVHAANNHSLRELATQIAELAQRARAGKITPAELDGGTFTVSNLGMFGVDEFHAIINPPQSGILAIGTTVERPVVRDGEVVIRSILRLSLSADHRVYSGVAGARFLSSLRELLEHPLALYS
jgi:pyruvate dehydrogenase E2 component (dihydrolipoamide acetyltransferase)